MALKLQIHARTIFLVSLFVLLANSTLFSQDQKEQLKKEKDRIEQELKYANDLLELTSSNREASMEELIFLSKKISQRERLITNITKEISYLGSEIRKNQSTIIQLNKDLNTLKSEYAKLIYYAFKNNNKYDRLTYIFSSQNVNQAYQRLKYLQYYTDYRVGQALQINTTMDSINTITSLLGNQKSNKSNLLSSHKDEEGKLKKEKQEKDRTIQDLSKKERQLKRQINKNQKESERLSKEIKAIIAAEILASTKKAKAEGETTTKGDFALTPDELELSGNFASNKGSLPWPSEKGVISSTFGEHNHPVLKRVKIKNNGIDILTNQNEEARAVFKGKVISIRSITNTNKAVIIRHGEYFTVYSNLAKVVVQQGQTVDTKQKLGTIYTESASKKTELHFEIWKGKTLLNPSSWVLKN